MTDEPTQTTRGEILRCERGHSYRESSCSVGAASGTLYCPICNSPMHKPIMGDPLDTEDRIANLIFDGPSGGEKARKLSELLKEYLAKAVDEARYG